MAQAGAIEHWHLRGIALILLVLLLPACATLQTLPDADAARELTSVPFFPQTELQCGPAALATVLAHGGMAVTPEQLAPTVFLPGRGGSLQLELLGAVRRAGRLPYLLTGGLDELVAEIDAGRPVLVLQNLGVSWYPRWHYAVVVGYDAPHDVLVLRSGSQKREVTARKVFLRTWARSERWAFVALAPAELPAQPNAHRYFEANAAAESVGQVAVADAGYRAMLERWPQNADAQFGLGNIRLREGRLPAARDLYRSAIAASGGTHLGAANNLAMAWLQSGCPQRAVAVIETALAGADVEDPLYESVRHTGAEARAASDLVEDVCDADQFED